jgi:hypothetical protein
MHRFGRRVKRSALARKKRYLTRLKARYKAARQRHKDLGRPAQYLWIMGCQRSGTTHLERIFRSDLDSAVFGEFGELSIHPGVSVWKPFPEVEAILSTCNARYVVARPLFESDRVRQILDHLPGSHAIWLFRDCLHVVDSMISKWGDRFFSLSREKETDAGGAWRLQELADSIERELGTGASVQNRYALYWLKRNEVVFTEGMDSELRFMCLGYEQLVRSPKYCVDTAMRRSGLPGVWRGFKTDTHARSVDKPVKNPIASDLQARCAALYERLERLAQSHFPDAMS